MVYSKFRLLIDLVHLYIGFILKAGFPEPDEYGSSPIGDE
jgi:hypothetical protein